MIWTVTTPPANTILDPYVNLPYHLNLDSDVTSLTEETDYLKELMATATEYAETATQSSLITRTITATFFEGDELSLPRGPVIAISSVTNGDGNPITTAKLERRGNTDLMIVPNGWTAPLVVVYTAGYGATGASVPADIRQAIRVHVGSMYENRESVQDRQLSVVPHSLEDFYARKCRTGVAG